MPSKANHRKESKKMTNEELITTIRDVKGATQYIDAVIDQVIAALGGEPTQEDIHQLQLKLEDV